MDHKRRPNPDDSQPQLPLYSCYAEQHHRMGGGCIYFSYPAITTPPPVDHWGSVVHMSLWQRHTLSVCYSSHTLSHPRHIPCLSSPRIRHPPLHTPTHTSTLTHTPLLYIPPIPSYKLRQLWTQWLSSNNMSCNHGSETVCAACEIIIICCCATLLTTVLAVVPPSWRLFEWLDFVNKLTYPKNPWITIAAGDDYQIADVDSVKQRVVEHYHSRNIVTLATTRQDRWKNWNDGKRKWLAINLCSTASHSELQPPSSWLCVISICGSFLFFVTSPNYYTAPGPGCKKRFMGRWDTG